jgi:amphi-Trp domain-containing protein
MPRDVERGVGRTEFAATLRRVAEAVEKGESIRIQVLGKRFTIPVDAELSIEHEASDAEQELELQLRWRDPSS